MRQIAVTDTKLRGVPRRLRALKKWAEHFRGFFPADPGSGYVYWKIPVHIRLVEGKDSSKAIRAECAQRLIDACQHLIAAKPATAREYRVICIIHTPNMFDSEVRIFSDEESYQSFMKEGRGENSNSARITGRSLAHEWGLKLPAGMGEVGMDVKAQGIIDGEAWKYESQMWLYGEVS